MKLSTITVLALCAIQSSAFADKTTTTTSSSSSTSASKVNKNATADGNVQPNLVAVSDAQIAKIVKTANTGEIDAAQYAKSNTKNKEVKDFADMMIKAHRENNKKADALANKLNLTPIESPVSENLKESASMDMKNLKSKKGEDLDRAYAESQVTMHQTVLSSLDNTLIPSAKNPELKDMLQKTRGDVAAHLEHAKALQESINNKKM